MHSHQRHLSVHPPACDAGLWSFGFFKPRCCGYTHAIHDATPRHHQEAENCADPATVSAPASRMASVRQAARQPPFLEWHRRAYPCQPRPKRIRMLRASHDRLHRWAATSGQQAAHRTLQVLVPISHPWSITSSSLETFRCASIHAQLCIRLWRTQRHNSIGRSGSQDGQGATGKLSTSSVPRRQVPRSATVVGVLQPQIPEQQSSHREEQVSGAKWVLRVGQHWTTATHAHREVSSVSATSSIPH